MKWLSCSVTGFCAIAFLTACGGKPKFYQQGLQT